MKLSQHIWAVKRKSTNEFKLLSARSASEFGRRNENFRELIWVKTICERLRLFRPRPKTSFERLRSSRPITVCVRQRPPGRRRFAKTPFVFLDIRQQQNKITPPSFVGDLGLSFVYGSMVICCPRRLIKTSFVLLGIPANKTRKIRATAFCCLCAKLSCGRVGPAAAWRTILIRLLEEVLALQTWSARSNSSRARDELPLWRQGPPRRWQGGSA
jgi:hypothetical protein